MRIRRYVPTNFLLVLLVGFLAWALVEVTRILTGVPPLYWPILAPLALAAAGMLVYFTISMVCYLQDHAFSTDGWRRFFIAAFLALILVYGGLTTRLVMLHVQETPTGGSFSSATTLYYKVLMGIPLEEERTSTHTNPPAPPRSANAYQGMDTLVVLLGLCLVSSIFYRKYRNKMITQRGYDGDNLLDIFLCVVSNLALFAAIVFPVALYVSAGGLAVLVLLRLRRMGPLHSITFSVLQIFAVFISCITTGGRGVLFMGGLGSRIPPGMQMEFLGARETYEQNRKEDLLDEEERRQMQEAYQEQKANRGKQAEKKKK